MIAFWTTDTASDGTKKSGCRPNSLPVRPHHAQVRGGVCSGRQWSGLHLATILLVAFVLSVPFVSADPQAASQVNSNRANISVQTTTNKVEPVTAETKLRGYDDSPQ